MKNNLLTLSIFTLSICPLFTQEDLLNELESQTQETEKFIYPAFKAMKIGNLQSTKVAAKGDLYLYVSHRFGTLEDGLSTFFGFDNANTKIQLVYGILDWLHIGVSRESIRKTYAGSVKFKILSQRENIPVNITGYGTVNINTLDRKDRFPFLEFPDRLSFASQLLISRRVSNSLSLEIAPTYIRQNLVFRNDLARDQYHDQLAFGIGARMKLTKRMSLNVDYVHNFNRRENSPYNDPFTIGVDIETGGHVFQLLFSNAQSTNEPGFISFAEGDWFNDVFFGFNIVRVF